MQKWPGYVTRCYRPVLPAGYTGRLPAGYTGR